MAPVILPGFDNITHDSQQTFRALLEAIARPLQPQVIYAHVSPPDGILLACAAACLTLLDFEATAWLQPTFTSEVRAWLQFHTGCKFVDSPQNASFAVISDINTVTLQDFCIGSAQRPEASTTLLIQQDSLSMDSEIGWSKRKFSGPGILSSEVRSLPLPDHFWQQWHKNHTAYPKGVDIFLFDIQTVIGLPRTTRAEAV